MSPLSRRLVLSSASLLLAVLLAGQVHPARSQQPTPTEAAAPSPRLAGIAHVAIRVHDLDSSVAFYQKLGFVEAFSLSREGKVYEAFIKINDRQFIELYPATPQQAQIGFLHLCFEGNDLPAAHAFYVAAGLTPNAVRTAGAGNLLFTMPGPASPTGPENMEYTQYMPGSLHSRDFGQHLGADRIAEAMSSVTLAMDDPAQARTFYLEKAGFLPGPEGSVRLPGAPEESLQFVPAATLGFRSRVGLRVKSISAAAATLKQRGLAYEAAAHTLTLTDPDGNQTVLEQVSLQTR